MKFLLLASLSACLFISGCSDRQEDINRINSSSELPKGIGQEALRRFILENRVKPDDEEVFTLEHVYNTRATGYWKQGQ